MHAAAEQPFQDGHLPFGGGQMQRRAPVVIGAAEVAALGVNIFQRRQVARAGERAEARAELRVRDRRAGAAKNRNDLLVACSAALSMPHTQRRIMYLLETQSKRVCPLGLGLGCRTTSNQLESALHWPLSTASCSGVLPKRSKQSTSQCCLCTKN